MMEKKCGEIGAEAGATDNYCKRYPLNIYFGAA
jgi:hypothetical protein